MTFPRVVACPVTLLGAKEPQGNRWTTTEYSTNRRWCHANSNVLLQIAHRAEAPVPAGVADAAFDRAFAQRRAGVWDGFGPDDDIQAGESYARAVEQFDAVARELDRS